MAEKDIVSDREGVVGCLITFIGGICLTPIIAYMLKSSVNSGIAFLSFLLVFLGVIAYFKISKKAKKAPVDRGIKAEHVVETDFAEELEADFDASGLTLEESGNKDGEKEHFKDCLKLSRQLNAYIRSIQANDEIMSDIKSIKGFEAIDKIKVKCVNPRIYVMLSHDIIKCYRELSIYDSSKHLMAILTVSFMSGEPLIPETGDYDSLDEKTQQYILESVKMIGKNVEDIRDSFTIEGFDGEVDFIFVKLVGLYGHDVTEYIRILHEMALSIVKCYKISNRELMNYPDKILSLMDMADGNDVYPDDVATASSKSESLPALDSLIGLNNVKQEIQKLSDFAKVQQLRQDQGLKSTEISYHCVFTGNPGTGKTTVARILADRYRQLGLLKKGHLVETDRSGLVAEYVGQTAVKTNKIIDSAIDGVLFIDEAYSLFSNGKNDFGQEALAILLKRMEDDRGRLIVILAGYKDEMQVLINSNPGLKSRFNRYIHFDDYNAEELWRIYEMNLEKHDYCIDEDAGLRVRQIISETLNRDEPTFGNARFSRNLFEKTLENQAIRIAADGKTDKESLQRIVLSDVISV